MNDISRRTLLKQLALTSGNVSIALPWLESIRLVGNDIEKSRETDESPQRLAMMYIPNGVIGDQWFTKTEGPELSLPSSLQPLEEVKQYITTFNGLNRQYLGGEPHRHAASCWLTSSAPSDKLDGDGATNKTLDQMVAAKIGTTTPFRTLELSCNSFEDNKESKKYDAISWYAPGHEAKSENNPQQVFRRLFGKPSNYRKSVLDAVLQQTKSFKSNVSIGDRKKIDEYLYSIRSIEKRIELQSQRKQVQVDMEMPAGIPDDRGEYIRLMGDMMVLAFQSDLTRVATFMVGPERWSTPLMFDGVFDKPVNHHSMTHDPKFDEQVAKIDRFHVQQYAYVIKKMKSIKEGEKSLLDSVFFVLGSGLGNGDIHSYERLPIVVAGAGGVQTAANRNIDCPAGTPLANLWLTIAQKMGLPISRFADSDGPLKQFC